MSASSRSPTLPSTSPSPSPGAVAQRATFAALTPAEWRGPERPEALARAAPRRPAADPPSAAPISRPRRAGPTRSWPPGIDRLRDAMPETAWHLTGSGGALFALAAGEVEASSIAASARRLGFPARACRTVAA